MLSISCGKYVPESLPDQNFNDNWHFNKGAVADGESVILDDTSWRKLNLPHDWAIEGPFDSKHNARTGGLPVDGEAWYRKHFTIPKEYKNKRISIEFDGAMSEAKVWLNGQYIGERPYGYIGFEFDLTKHIKINEDNVIAVQLHPKDLAARWYPGAGIYRNVRLKINEAVHIPQYGTYITTPDISTEKATVLVKTTLVNQSGTATDVVLKTEIKSAEGTIVATDEQTFQLDENTDQTVKLSVSNPKLWGVENPNLYTAVSSVIIDDTVVDVYNTEFGIRTIEVDRNKGFILNGKQVEFQGVCMHHDLGPLGSAVNFRAVERQLQIMQSMGVNALRTSHNPPSPEVLEVCDKLGIVVIVEAFDEWKKGKVRSKRGLENCKDTK